EQFDEAGTLAGAAEADGDLRRLSEVPVEASVEIGRTGMTVGETLELRVGSVVKLDRLAGEPVDLLVNGTLIAQGEVVVADEQFGLRVTEIVEGDTSGAAALEAQLAAERPRAPGETGGVEVAAPHGGDGALQIEPPERVDR
ncbi:MAG TPA: flagellar motor switch protein FliN, partial [Solirubrobacteraceae bacterium]